MRHLVVVCLVVALAVASVGWLNETQKRQRLGRAALAYVKASEFAAQQSSVDLFRDPNNYSEHLRNHIAQMPDHSFATMRELEETIRSHVAKQEVEEIRVGHCEDLDPKVCESLRTRF